MARVLVITNRPADYSTPPPDAFLPSYAEAIKLVPTIATGRNVVTVRGDYPGCGRTTFGRVLAHHHLPGKPPEIITPYKLMGGTEPAQFHTKWGSSTLPTEIALIILCDHLGPLTASFYDRLVSYFPRSPTIVVLGGRHLPDGSKALVSYGAPVVLRLEGSFRFNDKEEDDYAILLKALGSEASMPAIATEFYSRVLCDPRRLGRVLEKDGATLRDGAVVGVCGTWTEARKRNDRHARLTLDTVHLFASETFDTMHPVHSSTTFLAGPGSRVISTVDYTVPSADPPEEEEPAAALSDDDTFVGAPPAKRRRTESTPAVIPAGTLGTITRVTTLDDGLTVVSKGEGDTKWDPLDVKVVKPSAKAVVTVVFDGIDKEIWITKLHKPKKKNALIEEAVGRKWPFVPAHWLTIRDVTGLEFDRVHVVLRGVESRHEIRTALSRTKRQARSRFAAKSLISLSLCLSRFWCRAGAVRISRARLGLFTVCTRARSWVHTTASGPMGA